MMTVQEMIETLQKMDPTRELGVAFSDGWSSIVEIESPVGNPSYALIKTDDELFDRQEIIEEVQEDPIREQMEEYLKGQIKTGPVQHVHVYEDVLAKLEHM